MRAHAAVRHQRRDVLAEVVAARAHELVADLEGLPRRWRCGDRDQPAALAHYAERLLEALAAEDVERRVGAGAAGELAPALAQVAVGVVERLGAELAQEVVVGRRGGWRPARAAPGRALGDPVRGASRPAP